MDMAGNREHLFRIQLDHGAFIIFTIYREEVQQLSDVLLAAVKIPLVTGGLRDQVIGKLLENRKGTGRVKVEHIGVLLSVGIAVLIMEQAGILRTESCLHIKGRACHVGEHENRRPFGNRYAGGQLPHRQGDGLIVFRDGLFDPVKGLLVLIIVV